MANQQMDRCRFEQLLGHLNQETQSSDNKLRILFKSRGYFTAHQACRILYVFGCQVAKIKALQMMEPRLLPMSGSEAQDIIGTYSFMNDKLRALSVIKRYISNSQRLEGKEAIANSFVFDGDKTDALHILKTVRAYAYDVIPAGGHQLYGGLGDLYSQQLPVMPHLYGSPHDMAKYMPGKGIIEIPITAKRTLLPSKYTGHPSYAYRRGRDYAQERGYPGCGAYGEHMFYGTPECPAKPARYSIYPAGAPPLKMYQGATAPTAYQTHATYN